MSISNFIRILNSYFLRDQGQLAYGFSKAFGKRDPKANQKRKRAKEFQKSDALNNHKTTRLKEIYGLSDGEPGITFTLPSIALRFEVRPRKIADGIKKGDLLRVHVFDQSAGTAAQLQDVFMGFAGSGVTNIITRNETPKARTPQHSKVIADHISRLVDINAIFSVKDTLSSADKKGINESALEGMYAINLGKSPGTGKDKVPVDLKDIILKIFPTLIYGSMNTNIISADVSTQEDSALQSINMMRQGGQGRDGTGKDSGLPTMIMPTQLTMETLGCPFFAFMQQYFVDFGSNTTADNFYSIVAIDHKISAGNYTTSVSFANRLAFGLFTAATDEVKKLEAVRALAQAEGTSG